MNHRTLFSLILLGLSWCQAYCLDFGISSEKKKALQSKEQQKVDSLINYGKHFGLYDDSIALMEEPLKEAYFIASKSNYILGIIESANSLGGVYLQKNEFAKATNKHHIALRNAESINDTNGIHKSYQSLGLVMYSMNKWSTALEYFNKLEDYSRLEKHGNHMIEYLNGLCYFNLGHYEVAEKYLLRAQEISNRKGYSLSTEINLALLNIQVARDNPPIVLAELNKVLIEFEERNETTGVCYTLEGIAKSYLKSDMYEDAVLYAERSLRLAKKHNLIFPKLSILQVIIDAEYKNEDYQHAAQHMLELKELQESTMSQNTAMEVALLSADFEYNKKESNLKTSIAEKNRERTLFVILAIAFFVLTIVVLVSRRSVARERKKSDDVLYNMLPVETANELKQTGQAIAKAHNNVTVVFADVQSFTTIAGSLEPRILVQLLDYYFGKFDAIMRKYGLEKIKTIGDAYMFVSGLDSDDNANALKAVKAGMEMLTAIEDSKESMTKQFGNHFQFRIGMHTGKTVSGVVGTIKYAFDIWGDSVNVASRMEQMSEPGKINISEVTYSFVKDYVTCTPRGEISVKNKGSMHMYFVESINTIHTPSEIS